METITAYEAKIHFRETILNAQHGVIGITPIMVNRLRLEFLHLLTLILVKGLGIRIIFDRLLRFSIDHINILIA